MGLAYTVLVLALLLGGVAALMAGQLLLRLTTRQGRLVFCLLLKLGVAKPSSPLLGVLKRLPWPSPRPTDILREVHDAQLAPDDAIMVFDTYIEDGGNSAEDAQVVRELAQLCSRRNDHARARWWLDSLIARDVAGPQDLADRARMAVAEGDVSPLAIEVCQQARAAPDDEELRIRLTEHLGHFFVVAVACAEPKDADTKQLVDDARPLLTELREHHTNQPRFYSALMRCHYLAGDFQRCHQEARHAWEVFGDGVLRDMAPVWSKALLKLGGDEGFQPKALEATCRQLDLPRQTLVEILEAAQEEAAPPVAAHVLASLWALDGRRDDEAVTAYAAAVTENAAEPHVRQLYFQCLVAGQQWSAAVAVGQKLTARDRATEVDLTRCLVHAGEDLAPHLPMAERVWEDLQADPDYQQALSKALAGLDTWEPADCEAAQRLEAREGDPEARHRLRPRLLELELPRAARVAMFTRWWEVGGRAEDILERTVRWLMQHAPETPLLTPALEWLLVNTEVRCDLCSALFQRYRAANRLPDGALVAARAEERWQQKTKLTAEDLRLFREVQACGCRPLPATYISFVDSLLADGQSAAARELFDEFLDAGHFDRGLAYRMLEALTDEASDRKLEGRIWTLLLPDEEEPFRPLLGLLHLCRTGAEPPEVEQDLVARLIEDWSADGVSEEQRREAWEAVEPYLASCTSDALSPTEQDVLQFGVDREWVSVSTERGRTTSQQLCRSLLEQRPEAGVRFAVRLLELDGLTPELAHLTLKASPP